MDGKDKAFIEKLHILTNSVDKIKNGYEIEYLALPYSHDNLNVMDFRADISDAICAELMDRDRIIYAPISSCHHIAVKYGLPRHWGFWKKLDTAFVKISKQIIVIKLKHWKKSTGLNAELDIAKRHDIPVIYMDPTPYFRRVLLNCPFCDSDDIILYDHDDKEITKIGRYTPYIGCKECGGRTGGDRYLEYACVSWNTRGGKYRRRN